MEKSRDRDGQILIACHPYPGMTEEEARTARARAWSYILSCYEKHKAVEAQDGNVEAGFFAVRHEYESGRANYRNGGGDS